MDALQGDPVVYAELEALRESNGGTVTPQVVLDRASDPTSPLHEHFCWDDGEAAHRYRLQQAGALIRRFKIVRPLGDRVVSVPAFVRTGKEGYRPSQTVMTQDLLNAQHRARLLLAMRRLADELRSWDEFREAAELLDELAG